jgi:hypothetical protein
MNQLKEAEKKASSMVAVHRKGKNRMEEDAFGEKGVRPGGKPLGLCRGCLAQCVNGLTNCGVSLFCLDAWRCCVLCCGSFLWELCV